MRNLKLIILIGILFATPVFAQSTTDSVNEVSAKKPSLLQNSLMKLKPKSNESKEALDLDEAKLDAPPPASDQGLSVGPFSNIVFGGTLDYRFLFSNDMPEGMFMIHVNELFITTNIGKHFSVLAEQLLLTSDLGSTVGQDHGFVYVTVSNLPVLPQGTAFRIGRMRLRYGIDAKLDAPANPLRTPEYRTIGTISDRAIEMSGYFGPVEYAVAITQGPDTVDRYAITSSGEEIGPIQVEAHNSSHPLFLRIGTSFNGNVPNVGVSGFYGKGYPVLASSGFESGEAMLFGGMSDRTRLIQKERLTFDGRWNFWKMKLFAEYTLGVDHDAGEQTLQSWFVRTDFSIIPRRLTAQLQYDRFDDGRSATDDVGAMGAGLTLNLTDESWIRFLFQGNEKLLAGYDEGWVAGTQLVFSF